MRHLASEDNDNLYLIIHNYDTCWLALAPDSHLVIQDHQNILTIH